VAGSASAQPAWAHQKELASPGRSPSPGHASRRSCCDDDVVGHGLVLDLTQGDDDPGPEALLCAVVRRAYVVRDEEAAADSA
jgi:hypothetical protein